MKTLEERAEVCACNVEIMGDNGRHKTSMEIARESYLAGAAEMRKRAIAAFNETWAGIVWESSDQYIPEVDDFTKKLDK